MTDEFRLPLTPHDEYSDDTRVRLRGDFTDVYDLAKANSEGWVRARSHDPVGAFPMVLIEWDKKHWAYNGQDNMWTYETHFEPVNKDKQMSTDDEAVRAALQVLAARLGADDKADDNDHHAEDLNQAIFGEDEAIDDDAGFIAATDDQYLSTLKQALKAATQGESFVLITVGTEKHPATGRPILVPHIFKADKTEEASVLTGVHLAQIGLLAFQDLAMERITDILEAQDDYHQDR